MVYNNVVQLSPLSKSRKLMFGWMEISKIKLKKLLLAWEISGASCDVNYFATLFIFFLATKS